LRGKRQTPEERIAVLDFGSQYTQLIARRVREFSVFCEIYPFDVGIGILKDRRTKGIIMSGGPSSVYEKNAPLPDERIYEIKKPILGICYGLQVTAHLLGGSVAPSASREYGRAELHIDRKGNLFKGLPSKVQVWMSHGDRADAIPPGFEPLAHSSSSPYAAIADKRRRIYGIQFHPEVVHTPRGKDIIKNFLFDVCGCSGGWSTKSFVDASVENIRRTVGRGKIICGMSGGIDSAVTAVLIHKAVGDQLTSIFVNNGLLRKGEIEQVLDTFRGRFKMNLKYVDDEEGFLSRLKNIIDPEEKRKVIGERFIRVFEREAKKLGKVDYLAQGTLYPDRIESKSVKGPSSTIKTHHNVGGLPAAMKLKLVEPVRDLFKDEVRKVGKELGLPEALVRRQPFPGPGLAVRTLGEVTKERLDVLRECDAVFLEELERAGLSSRIAQAFAVLLPVKSVGVMGDGRTYQNVVALRAVTTDDFMTADWFRIPHDVLARISTRIINEVKNVNRVVYDVSTKPPATIEWE
jgi:GMP synthase (glutamine-hydrolysing)